MSDIFEQGFSYLHNITDNLSGGKDYFDQFASLLDALHIYVEEETLEEMYDAKAKRFTNITIDALWTVFKASKIPELTTNMALENTMLKMNAAAEACESPEVDVPEKLARLTHKCTNCGGEFDNLSFLSSSLRRSKLLPNTVFCVPECLLEYHSKIQKEFATALFEVIDIKSPIVVAAISEYIIADILSVRDDVNDITKNKLGMTVAELANEYHRLIK